MPGGGGVVAAVPSAALTTAWCASATPASASSVGAGLGVPSQVEVALSVQWEPAPVAQSDAAHGSLQQASLPAQHTADASVAAGVASTQRRTSRMRANMGGKASTRGYRAGLLPLEMSSS